MSIPDLRSTAALLEEGRTDEAREVLTSLVRQAPTYLAAHVLLARIAEAQDDRDAALKYWRAAYALSPQSPLVERGLRDAVLRRLDDGSRAAGQSGESDLDHLIHELETARIIPDPNVETIAEEELENDIGDLVSETLARIYASQGHFAEAAGVYDTLARQQPDRRNEYEAKAADLRRKSEERD